MSIEIFEILMQFAGGLGLFIYGMKLMGDGLEKAAGNKMKKLLEVLTTNKYMGVLVGALVTAIIQSSSASTVMVIGFVNAGLMNLIQATGVIMGANVGTTVTAQLIAFNLTKIAPVAVFIGVIMMMFIKNRTVKKLGEVITGFGILFMGMALMTSAMEPLRDNPVFVEMMTNVSNPIIGILVGASVTAIVQSSSASIGILQALALQGLIGLDGAVFILFGQNIGTCVTALLASIGTSKTAKKAALIHLIFNVFGSVLFSVLIVVWPQALNIIQIISPQGDTVREIANAHTIFNILNTLLMLPLAGMLVRFANFVMPGQDKPEEAQKLLYLDTRILETPPIALAQIFKEVKRMGNLAYENVEMAMKAFFDQDENTIKEVYRREEILNYLNREITHFLVLANESEMQQSDKDLIMVLFHVVSDLERVGDHAENLVEYAEYRLENKINFSDIAIAELLDMTDRVLSILHDSLEALINNDKELAVTVEPREDYIDELEQTLRTSHIARLNTQRCTAASGVVFLDIISNLERISDHASNVAYAVLE